ncbi:hypothetical protein [Photobacterium lutimaris]|uniref:Uncharacterized protein n=1 Tax=Photobacterium lutimaris TaxID=388278 RepID=A0A2T3ITM5_9GAMM|nr:hypothetical protein [Photobacterium lutimaris]PSU31716.1 hypothetical protein C9I99_21250 [Photobacterium lutimaris]TDR72645.1 hypothetical protein DFP78_113121 [Photobacterium lutimaris]
MEKIEIGEFEKSCLLAAIQGYTTNGMQAKEASREAVELVRCLSKELILDDEILAIDYLNKVQQFESRIGRSLDDNEKYHIRKALNDDMSIDDILANNHNYQ